MPDDRTVVDSKTKIRKLLVSAYPDNAGSAIFTELATDNIVDEGKDNPNTKPIFEEMAYWKDLTRTDNDDTKSFWTSCYNAIANANLALQRITELKGANFEAERGEALMARAFSHFMLVNVFAKHYNPATADSDLGITYMVKGETTLNPKYKRSSVAEVYKNIEKDIETALPLISDDMYEQPKYHFTKKAAYAFAARFYLYYGKWEKAVEYADKVLEVSEFINWAYLGTLSANLNYRAKELQKDKGCMLLLPDITDAGLLFGAYYYGARINHTRFIADRETATNKMPWGALDPVGSYHSRAFAYSANNYQKVNFPNIPMYFEVKDPVAGIGYYRAIYTTFTTDQVALIRAEAKIHLGQYAEALADLNAWTRNYFKNGNEVTLQEINDFYNGIPYSEPTADGLTQKKKLNPVYFTIKDKEQENMLHYVLQCRRLLTLHSGLRWYDVKRFGIEVARLQKQKNGEYQLIDKLVVGDNRRAMQIPQDVISSGLEPNPR
ncbi:MAG: RagB/SusD family protein [Bacteroidia bacterium]|nr:MAG: RagB/SusD family protein [Bacteroidia bacterium]